MTTLKELKELDAKAASALDNLKHNQGQLDMDGCIVSVSRQAVDETIAFVEYTRNALPDLIRVIELAEELINQGNFTYLSAEYVFCVRPKNVKELEEKIKGLMG